MKKISHKQERTTDNAEHHKTWICKDSPGLCVQSVDITSTIYLVVHVQWDWTETPDHRRVAWCCSAACWFEYPSPTRGCDTPRSRLLPGGLHKTWAINISWIRHLLHSPVQRNAISLLITFLRGFHRDRRAQIRTSLCLQCTHSTLHTAANYVLQLNLQWVPQILLLACCVLQVSDM